MILEGDNLIEMKKLADNSVDLIITSPPYAEQRNHTYGGVPADRYIDWFLPRAWEMKRVLKPTGSLFLNIKSHVEDGERHLYVMELVIAMKRYLGFRFIDDFAWTKNGFPGKFRGRFKNGWEPVYHFTKENASKIKFHPEACATPIIEQPRRKEEFFVPDNGSGFTHKRHKFNDLETALPSNVLAIKNISNQFTSKKLHSATFPVALCDFFIKSFSDRGDTILDPFGGSGTTAVSAIENAREYIIIEKESENIKIIKQRISNTQYPIL